MTMNAVTVREWGLWGEREEILQRYLFDFLYSASEGSKAILDKGSQVGVLFFTEDDRRCWWMVQEQGTPTVCSPSLQQCSARAFHLNNVLFKEKILLSI